MEAIVYRDVMSETTHQIINKLFIIQPLFLCISYKVGDDVKRIVKNYCKQEQNLLNRLATNCPITVQFCIILHLCILWTPFSVVGLEGDHIQFQNMIGL